MRDSSTFAAVSTFPDGDRVDDGRAESGACGGDRERGFEGVGALKRAAVRAVTWLAQFKPAELDGRPAPVRGLVMTFDFGLRLLVLDLQPTLHA